MKASDLALILGSLALTGCSAGSSLLSTGSIFGGSNAPSGATAVQSATDVSPVITSDPTSRAFQVGTVAARAVKCGYNFDAQKLRTSFLAAEAGAGATSTDLPRIEQIYDVSFNGVTKATAADPKYCTDQRTRDIKADLNRHLAGDYTPPPAKKVVAESGGLFSGWGDSGNEKGLELHHPMDNRY
jgi:hypothetical protein